MTYARITSRVNVGTSAGLLAGSLLLAPCWTPAWGVQPQTAATTDAGGQMPRTARYLDGTYTATGQYGNEPSFITVTVRLADGVIRQVTVTPHAVNPTSRQLQERFAAEVPRVVVGKPIAEVNVGRLAGSSGTPKGFNAAIRKIRDQATRKDSLRAR